MVARSTNMDTLEISGKSTEECVRRKWKGKFDFILAALCCILGLGDVSVFPLLIYTNGGGAFFVPYLCCLVLVGLPTFFLELKVGQFSSSGPLTCWDFCPIISGCGVTMLILMCIMAAYYNIIIAWAIYFFLSIFSHEIPWAQCGNWSTRYCIDNVRFGTKYECYQGHWTIKNNGLCLPENGSDVLWVWSEAIARKNNIILTYPTFEYFHRVTLGHTEDVETFSLLSVNMQMLLYLLLAWCFVWMFAVKGMKIPFKFSLALTVFPYLILLVLLVRGLTLDGARDGLLYFLVPDVNYESFTTILCNGIRQVCFSLSVAYGSLITLSSYNKFHYDFVRDTFILPIADFIIGVLAGFVIFSHLGFLANSLRVNVDGLAKGGPLLIFEVLPYVISKLGAPSVWCAFFFIMIIAICLNSQRVIMESLIRSIVDWRPECRKTKHLTSAVLCFLLFLLGLPMTTAEGLNIFKVLFESSGGLNVLVPVFLENFAVGWLYGADRFIRDIEIMTGSRYCTCFMFGRVCRIWWKLSWKFITPTAALSFIIITLADKDSRKHSPVWMSYIRWSVTGLCMGSIVLVGLFRIVTLPGSVKQKLMSSLKPTQEWGPALAKHRQLMRQYIPNFVVNLRSSSSDSELIPVSQTSELAEVVCNNDRFDTDTKQNMQEKYVQTIG